MRPALSMSWTESSVMPTLPTFIRMAMTVMVPGSMPFAERKAVEKLKALLMPENLGAESETCGTVAQPETGASALESKLGGHGPS